MKRLWVAAWLMCGSCHSSHPSTATRTPVLMIQEIESPVVLAPPGSETFDRPEIGRLDINFAGAKYICTGTLIHPEIVLTAAHCVGYKSGSATGLDRFTIHHSAGISYEYEIKRFYSYGASVGADDIAIVQLTEPVDPRHAQPTQLARATPEKGAGVHVYGYGCTNRRTGHGMGTKRQWGFDWIPEGLVRLCYGDSGGPVVLGSSGGVFAVNSGHEMPQGTDGSDIYAYVARHRDAILQRIHAWTATARVEGVPGQPPYYINVGFSPLARVPEDFRREFGGYGMTVGVGRRFQDDDVLPGAWGGGWSYGGRLDYIRLSQEDFYWADEWRAYDANVFMVGPEGALILSYFDRRSRPRLSLYAGIGLLFSYAYISGEESLGFPSGFFAAPFLKSGIEVYFLNVSVSAMPFPVFAYSGVPAQTLYAGYITLDVLKFREIWGR